MRKIIFGLFIVLFTISVSSEAYSQKGLKIGVVDVETIFKAMPEFEDADKLLLEISKKYQDTLLMMRQGLEAKAGDYQKQKAMMPADQQQKREEELQAENMNVYQYQQEKAGEIQKMRVDFLEPIKEKVTKAIEEVSKEEKINIVFDKASQSIVYAEDKFDLTFKIIDRIKRGAK